jgi:D-beta-D-heptose 7-phosphate kinase/D-beta-D-heptose 1-phosphate adenosyltransferase
VPHGALAVPGARELFARMRDKRVLVIGDVMLDEWVWGSVSRISPEAPVPVVAVDDHSFTLGGAGNVANNLRASGARVSFAGAVGDDAEGRRVLELFDAIEVDRRGLIAVTDRPTTRKTRIVAHNQQVVRADWESVQALCGRALGLRERFVLA